MSITIQEKLLKLPDNLRATVQLIHSLFEKGLPLRYSDIRQARIAAGMSDGSSTTIRNALEIWREIYDIKLERYESPTQIDNLAKRAVEFIRNEVSVAYRQEAEIKIAAADEAIDDIKHELKITQLTLNERTVKLDEAKTKQVELVAQLETAQAKIAELTQQNQSLFTEVGQLNLKLTASDDKVKQAQAEVAQREHAFDSLRDEMERQRQSQLKVIDDWQQQYKSANKTIEQLRQQLEHAEKTNQGLQSKSARHVNKTVSNSLINFSIA